jgi:hypothetical protein
MSRFGGDARALMTFLLQLTFHSAECQISRAQSVLKAAM